MSAIKRASNSKKKIYEGLAWSLFFLSLGIWGFYLGFTSPSGTFRVWKAEPQDVLLYTESEALADVFKDMQFTDWNLSIAVIDEPTEWEIKTLAGRGAHLVLIERTLMEQLNRVSLLERARIRVPLFSFLYPDFRKQDWEKVYLPLFWQSEDAHLNTVKIWGFSVPQNSPDRKLSWKAFYELVRHPLFKARLAGSQFGLTLQEFEESSIPAERKPSFIRQWREP